MCIVPHKRGLQDPTPIHGILRERRVVQVRLLPPNPRWMRLLSCWRAALVTQAPLVPMEMVASLKVIIPYILVIVLSLELCRGHSFIQTCSPLVA